MNDIMDQACTKCGRDNRNGTHTALEQVGHLSHQWTPPKALTFKEFATANASRKQRWHGETDTWLGSDWSNAMAGEAGEACNVVKKLRRHETHAGTSYNTPPVAELLPKLAAEIADTITYAFLLADYYDIDVEDAIREKFNLVSLAQDFPERV